MHQSSVICHCCIIFLSLLFHFLSTTILLAAQDRLTQHSDYILYYSFKLRLSRKALTSLAVRPSADLCVTSWSKLSRLEGNFATFEESLIYHFSSVAEVLPPQIGLNFNVLVK